MNGQFKSGSEQGANVLDQSARQQWMALLSKAVPTVLEEQVAALGDLPKYQFLRSPEIGLAMVRGRAEGSGQPFNLGEMTITRCVIQLGNQDGLAEHEKPLAGFGYVAGRSQRHAELAAVCDALLQDARWHDRVHTQVLGPLKDLAQRRREQNAAEVEATRVNFFTMRRGES
ncbi:phosphonate C-P lyase system protein PhnG [Leptothoe sp. PORK10 BA2]|uniref:phosphonate C-P lyase system protein PhnG n=1 Tax=Leptothoe sp. PORK10 BA2 TaxID=3110254 RepID=UPI002B1F65FB|nr:phosphonate C-P lyase system protein PhnG [Leptothoe sp. PORK10 BA2]MEA5465807.1 phosphonate C-P lyase system protein PhnG [Leptothoe sp. PORK10 BA2]